MYVGHSSTSMVSEIQPTPATTGFPESTSVFETSTSVVSDTTTPKQITQPTVKTTTMDAGTTNFVPQKVIYGKLRITGQDWNSKYEDTTSEEYRILYQQVQPAVSMHECRLLYHEFLNSLTV